MKVIYIIGAGRSGSTILEVALGNSENIFDAGELVRFFKLGGKPHGFSPESDNYKFWLNIGENFKSRINQKNISDLSDLTISIEYHSGFFKNLFHVRSKKKVKEYKSIVNSFFEVLSENIEEPIILDGSKYPGRALALYRSLDWPVYFIYMKRNPKGVVQSFGQKNVEQPSKSFLMANLYYFAVNFLATIVKWIVPKSRFMSVKYENFIKTPEEEITKIQKKFNIDLSKSINLIRNDKPLKVGHLFDGNRIRLKDEIIIQKQNIKYRFNFKNLVTDFVNGIWYY